MACINKEGGFVPLRPSDKHGESRLDSTMRSYGYSSKAAVIDEAEEDQLRFVHGIRVEGSNVPSPVRQFSDGGLPPFLVQWIQRQGYVAPTSVQMQSLPCQLAGRDVIVIAETGSGKTLAYCAPIATALSSSPPTCPGSWPKGLILVPSRELARQVEGELSALLSCIPPPPLLAAGSQRLHAGAPARPVPFAPSAPARNDGGVAGYRCLAVFGGESSHGQIAALRSGVDVVVATPGRLLDLIERRALSLDCISHLVMDEADQMLGRGFEDQLRKIVGLATSTHIPRQTSLWSATMPESLSRLARSAVLNPITIHAGYSGLTARGISQHVHFMHHYQKPKRLLQVIRQTVRPPALVFCGTSGEVEQVVEQLRQEQFHVAGLHGELPQAARNEAMDAFRDDQCDVLVATDLASRGINIPSISCVINYSLPATVEVYVHRCGRTGRMGVGGEATSFLTLDCKIAAELRDLLVQCQQDVPIELEDVKQFGKHVVVTEFGDRAAIH